MHRELLSSFSFGVGIGGIDCRLERALGLLDACGKPVDDEHLPRTAFLGSSRDELLARIFVADDLDVVTEGLIAMGVIEMKMGIDDVAHGLVGEVLELFHERPRGGGRHVRVDEQDVVFIDDDAAVASDGQVAGSDRVVDVVTDFVEREGLTLPCAALDFRSRFRPRLGDYGDPLAPGGGSATDPALVPGAWTGWQAHVAASARIPSRQSWWLFLTFAIDIFVVTWL